MSTTHDVAISPALLTKAQAEVYVGSPTVFSDLCARHQIRPLYRGVGKGGTKTLYRRAAIDRGLDLEEATAGGATRDLGSQSIDQDDSQSPAKKL